MTILLLRSILERNIKGELAELGVWKGYTAKLIHCYVPEREVISIIFENAFESLFYKGSNKKNINLYIEQNEGRAIIKIEDNGTGVGHKYKDLIFKEGSACRGYKNAGLDYHTHYHVYKNMVVICFWIIIILQGQGL